MPGAGDQVTVLEALADLGGTLRSGIRRLIIPAGEMLLRDW